MAKGRGRSRWQIPETAPAERGRHRTISSSIVTTRPTRNLGSRRRGERSDREGFEKRLLVPNLLGGLLVRFLGFLFHVPGGVFGRLRSVLGAVIELLRRSVRAFLDLAARLVDT